MTEIEEAPPGLVPRLRLAVARLVLLTFVIGVLAVSALGAASGQAAGQSPNLPPGTVRSAVISDTTFLFPDRLPLASGGEDIDAPRDELTEEERQAIQAAINRNIDELRADGKLPPLSAQAVSLQWPLRASDRLTDYGYHAIWDFVDHNPNYPNQLLDYNCGSRTYDRSTGYNHRGTDFGLWPFPWNKMYGDEVQVVSAAAGTIVDKRDGNYDRNCTVGQGASWNAVYVRHGDGSVAWYGHLKNGSLTSKTVGSYVQAGEYLGIVGSSGGSLEPHLHFELYDASNHLIDAYEGACNSLNSQSWWASQRPYYDSAINLLMTGDAPVENQPCPNPTITHAADRFNPGDTVYFTAFYRDLLAGQVSQGAIYRPDGSVFQSWTYSNTTPHVPARTKWWSYRLSSDAMHGTWRFEVVYAGQTYRTLFSVGDLLRTYLPVVLKTH